MQLNLPVTQQENDWDDSTMIVSATDTRGYITHCNDTFVHVSGYSLEELVGANHNILRHPDVPTLAFKDLWRTIGRGRQWTGVVKNRCKNGDHYWVTANVAPIMKGGKPIGYLSVRTKPNRAEIAAAEALFKAVNEAKDPATLPVMLEGGVLWRKGLAGVWQRLAQTSLGQRLSVGLALLTLPALLPLALPLQGWALAVVQWSVLAAGAAALGWWFHRKFDGDMEQVRSFTDDLAACNLATTAPRVRCHRCRCRHAACSRSRSRCRRWWATCNRKSGASAGQRRRSPRVRAIFPSAPKPRPRNCARRQTAWIS